MTKLILVRRGSIEAKKQPIVKGRGVFFFIHPFEFYNRLTVFPHTHKKSYKKYEVNDADLNKYAFFRFQNFSMFSVEDIEKINNIEKVNEYDFFYIRLKDVNKIILNTIYKLREMKIGILQAKLDEYKEDLDKINYYLKIKKNRFIVEKLFGRKEFIEEEIVDLQNEIETLKKIDNPKQLIRTLKLVPEVVLDPRKIKLKAL